MCVCPQMFFMCALNSLNPASVHSYRATILQHAVGEAAVALSSDLHVIGALQQHSLLQVARRGVHVGHAVLAVVGEVLRDLSGQQPQESHLDGGGVWCQAVVAVVELDGAAMRTTEPLRSVTTAAAGKEINLVSLTWNPPFIVSPNQTCLRSLLLLVHQFLRGMLDGLGRTQVSPVSMLQKTLMASMVHPWLGSIQYSPARVGRKGIIPIYSTLLHCGSSLMHCNM